MAVMQNKIVFGAVDSSTYNIYVSGEGVFNAPKRDVEMITIPGRNGAFILDKGRFENITVRYPAFTYETSMATFQQNLANFRNALSAQKGYQRLTDSFHTDEYRMAAFVDGIEINPIKYNTASGFDIIFECKPQRWLTSGETKSTVANNGTLSNPTLFDASPLIEVTGYGTLRFNNYAINLQNAVMGNVLLADSVTYTSLSQDIIFDKTSYQTGDTITLDAGLIDWSFSGSGSNSFSQDPTNTSDSNSSFSTTAIRSGSRIIKASTQTPITTFTAGTNKTVSNTATTTTQVVPGATTFTATSTQTITYTANYSGNNSKITISQTLTFSVSGKANRTIAVQSSRTGAVTVESTQSLLGNPTYIDCDLGEAYKIQSGSYISLNSKISLGSQLPVLGSGTNTITYDNTITSVKITPRWWKV